MARETVPTEERFAEAFDSRTFASGCVIAAIVSLLQWFLLWVFVAAYGLGDSPKEPIGQFHASSFLFLCIPQALRISAAYAWAAPRRDPSERPRVALGLSTSAAAAVVLVLLVALAQPASLAGVPR